MSTWALDYDDTLVDTQTQEWLPGALDRLRALVGAGETVFIHSARANYDYGRQTIAAKLAEGARLANEPRLLDVKIHPKPYADHYVDDKALSAEAWRGTPPPPRVGKRGSATAVVSMPSGWWRTQH